MRVLLGLLVLLLALERKVDCVRLLHHRLVVVLLAPVEVVLPDHYLVVADGDCVFEALNALANARIGDEFVEMHVEGALGDQVESVPLERILHKLDDHF